jgi:thiamine kinase-like enzyme
MDIERILKNSLSITGWEIRKPPSGLSKEAYIAKAGDKEVFIKFDADVSCLSRLGELGIAPRVLSSGNENGIPFLIQEYVRGVSPTAEWFISHLSEVAEVIREYHNDGVLARLLREQRRVETADDRVKKFKTIKPKLPIERKALEIVAELQEQLSDIVTSDLSPVHADPNKKNFLIEDRKVWIIDWDDIVLSDPLRDVGPVCYWYLPEEFWPQFLGKLGYGYQENAMNRLYWWITVRSLKVFWWYIHQNSETGEERYFRESLNYLEDAQAAIKRKPNPHYKF